MKRMKKLLTGLLTLAMTLSMMTMTAFADEPSATGTAPKMPTIDTERTGSITIHKYEYNGTGGVAGTGNADDTIPVGATALAGVEYTVWKLSDLTNYYEYNSTEKLPKADDFTVEKDGSSWKLKKNGTLDGTLIGSQTTGATGVVKFTGLTLGIYYVNETKAPDKVYKPVAASKDAGFLVSIPMTNPKNNEEWIYDVNVFPKNKTASGGVVLTKKGKCGTEVSDLAGAEFVLQKKFGEDWKYVKKDTTTEGSWKYDETTKPTTSTDGILKTDENGTISVKDLAHGTYRFLEVDSTDDPGNRGYIIDETKEYEFTVKTDGTIEWAEAAEGTKANGTTGTAATITIVNHKPNVEKDVKDRTDGTWGKDSDYSVGDTIPYRVTVDVPANIAKLKTFTLTDTPEHQTYVDDSLKIYSDADATTQILTSYTTGTVKDGDGWKIAFTPNDTELSTYAGKKIYITFDMKLKENAVIVGLNGNTNEIKLDYSNKILPGTAPNPGTDEIIKETTVYTFGIAVEKVDADDTNKKLEGVTFDLYRELGTDTTEEGVTDPVKGLTGKFKKVKEGLTTKTDGTVSVSGLANGTYWLVETKTIDTYNLLKKPIKVQIAATYSETETITINKDSTGKTTTTTTKEKHLNDAGNNGVFTTVVKNSKGFILPTTGGIGTFVFTFAGIAMMAAAVILLITGKKKKAE